MCGRRQWAIGPALGVAVNLRDEDNTSLFAEVEANYVTANKAYIGTGLASGTSPTATRSSPTVLLNFACLSGRLHEEGASSDRRARCSSTISDEIDNNYMFWAACGISGPRQCPT